MWMLAWLLNQCLTTILNNIDKKNVNKNVEIKNATKIFKN